MITDGYKGMDLRESDTRRINVDGLYRRIQETGHCPLRDYDYANLAKAYGIGVGSMMALISKTGLAARLEEESMGRKSVVNDTKAMGLYKAGKTDFEISLELECAQSTITSWRHKNGLPANGHTRPDPVPQRTPEEQAAMEAMAERLADRKPATINADFDQAVNSMVAENKASGWTIPEFTRTDFEAERASIDAMYSEPVVEAMDEGLVTNEQMVQVEHDVFAIAQELREEVSYLRSERLVLIGIAIGAGVRDVERVLKEAIG